MIVPQYWAEARLQQRQGSRQITVRRFGWSDESQEKAQQHADERVREAFDRVLAGDRLPRREPKVAYNGAEGLPIREEIVQRHGQTVITRNSYGALCLNTPHVMFVDIDFDDPGPAARLRRHLRWPLLVGAVAIGLWWHSWWLRLAAVAAALWLAHVVSHAFHRRQWQENGGPERRAHERITGFAAAHPKWRLRVYRTPAGLRLLVMHRTFDPTDPIVQQAFASLGADPFYALMCQRQRCFRARVSPKPWRIGIARHLAPRPGTWPIKPERMPDRLRWVAEYEKVAAGYAACVYLHEVGSGADDAAAVEVRNLHDALCQAERSLPAA